MTKRFYLFIAAAMLLAACNSDDPYLNPVQIPDANVLSVRDVDLSPTGGEFSVAFTSDVAWTLQNCPSWLHASAVSGKKGTTIIQFKAGVNDVREDRSVTLSFLANDGSFENTMEVSQPFPYLRIDRDSIGFEWSRARTVRPEVPIIETVTEILKINSNVDWRITEVATKAADVDLTHFGISTLAGFADNNVEVVPIKDNYSKEPYKIEIKLEPMMPHVDGKPAEVIDAVATDSYVIKLHQNNLRFLINGSTDDIEFEFDDLDSELTYGSFEVDCEQAWKVVSAPEWVTMGKREETETEKIVDVAIHADGANPVREVRTGVVRLQTGAGAYRDVAVRQKPFVFNLSSSAKVIGNDDLEEYEFTLNTNGTWEIEGTPEWLTVTPASGDSTKVITFKSNEQNLKLEDIKGTLKVKSLLNEIVEDFAVSQDRFIFEMSVDPVLSAMPTMVNELAPTLYPVKIKSSGAWRIEGSDVEWLSADKISSDTKGEFTVNMGACKSYGDLVKDREQQITLVSVNHENKGQELKRTFKAVQKKFIFELAPSGTFENIPAYKADFKGAYSARLECTAGWEITTCPSWITADVSSGDGSKIVNIAFTPAVNKNKSDRSGEIVITSTFNNQTKKIAVSQDQFVFGNEAETFENIPVIISSQSYTVPFDLTSESGWTIVECPAWIKASAQKGVASAGKASVTFTPVSNPGLVARSAAATISSDVTGETKTVTFTQNPYVFDFTEESFSYTELPGSKTDEVNIVSSGKWTISDAPSWISLSATSGSGNAVLKITPSKNGTTKEKSAAFHIVTELGSHTRTVNLHQDPFKFNAESVNLSYKALEERTDNINLLCSGSWELRDAPAWVTFSAKSGSGAATTQTITVSSKKYTTAGGQALSADVLLVSKDFPETFRKSIKLSQEAFVFSLDKTSITCTSALDVTPRSVSVNISEGAPWTVASSGGPVSLSASQGVGSSTITVTPVENLEKSAKTVSIEFKSTLNGDKKTLVLSQPAFHFAVDKSSHTFDALDKTTLTVNVDCTSDWTMSTSATWLVLQKVNSSVTVNALNNTSSSPREATVVITSEKGGYSATVQVNQNAYVFNIDPQTVSFDAEPAGTKQVSVKCSGTWSCSSNKSWLTASKTSDGITLTASANPEQAERTAIVTVSTAEGHTKNIEVKQAAKVPEVNE